MLDELRRSVRESMTAGDSASLTRDRGRLISALEKEIDKLSSKEQLTEEETKLLESFKNELNSEIHNHRVQLQARYSNEFIRTRGTIDKIVEIPKNCGLALDATIQCIKELKNAKNNKQKIFRTLELAKQAGVTIATPVIAVGKCLLNYWYVPFAMLSFLKVTDSNLFREFIKNTNLNDTEFINNIDKIRDNFLVKPAYSVFDDVTDAIFNKSDELVEQASSGLHK